MNRRTATAAVGALALALGAGGCTQDFPPFNRLDSLRVLAIQSEPAAPLSGETATITPLIFNPTDDPGLKYTWSWCPIPGPAAQAYECLVKQEQLAALLGPDVPLPSFDLGNEPTAMLQNSLPPEVLQAFCSGMAPGVPRPNCAGGLPVQISLSVKTSDDKEEVKAVVTTRWRYDADMQSPNANPVVDGLEATLAGGTAQDLPPPDMLTADTVTLPRDVATNMKARASVASSETYNGLNEEDEYVVGLQERLYITWFIESGDTDNPRTSYIPMRTDFDKMLNNTWTPEVSRLYAPNQARIYVVLHDNRGGVGWRGGIVNLGPTP